MLKFLGVLALCGALSGAAPAAPAAPSMLHIEGNRIVNQAGAPVRLTGVNVPSLEWGNEGEHVLHSVRVACDEWGANVIRLPLAQDRWLGSAPFQDDGGAAYRKTVDDVVRAVSEKGAYVVLDLHWSNAGQMGRSIGQHKMPDDNSQIFWAMVSRSYANDPAVLFDLYNEPHDVSWEVWKNGGAVQENIDDRPLAYHSPGMQQLASVIRANGARNVLIAGGLDWGYDLSGIPKGAALDDRGGGGIVYGTHIYAWKGSGPDNWNPYVGDIARQYAVWVGEVGVDPKDMHEVKVAPETWARDILAYLDAHDLGWAGWTFHPGATPRMIESWNYEPTPFWGTIAKDALLKAAKTRAK